MQTLMPLFVAILLLLVTAAIAGAYLSAFAPLLRRSGASRAIRLVARAVTSLVRFVVTLVIPRRPRRVRSLPSAHTDRRARGTNHHDRLF